jgi:hypothetical protein
MSDLIPDEKALERNGDNENNGDGGEGGSE